MKIFCKITTMRQRDSRGSGFTLIEMLVVIMIISILAAIGVPQYLKSTEKARAAEAMMILGALNRAEQRYITRWGKPSLPKDGDLGKEWLSALDVEVPELKYFDDSTLTILKASETDTRAYSIAISRKTDSEYNPIAGIGDEKGYEVVINNKGDFIDNTPAALR